MSRNNLPKLALAFLISLNFCAPAFASALLESAKQDFQLKRYHASADTLNKVVQNEPGNPEGYYWLGRALEELKDRDGAKTMYMSAFKLNPFGPHAALAKKAMMDLAVKQAAIDHPTDGPEVTAQTLQLIERETTDWKRMKVSEGNMRAQSKINAGNLATFNAGYYGGANMQLPNIALPTGSNAPIQSISEIRAQQRANGTAGNPYLNVGNPLTKRTYDNWAGYPGNATAQNYYQPGAAGAIGFIPGAGNAGTGYGAPLAGGYNGGYPGGYGGGYPGAMGPYRGGYGGAGGYGGYGGGAGGVGAAGGYGTGYGGYNQTQYNPINLYGNRAVSNQAQINTSYLRGDTNVQALHAQQQGVQSAAELQKSANNLESLLGEKPKAGSPHLRALGTNLFVRNYSEHDDDSLPPVDPVLELKARQEKLSDLDKGDHARANKLMP